MKTAFWLILTVLYVNAAVAISTALLGVHPAWTDWLAVAGALCTFFVLIPGAVGYLTDKIKEKRDANRFW